MEGANARVNAIAPGGLRNAVDPQGEYFQRLYAERCRLNRMAGVEGMVGPSFF